MIFPANYLKRKYLQKQWAMDITFRYWERTQFRGYSLKWNNFIYDTSTLSKTNYKEQINQFFRLAIQLEIQM